MIGDVVWPSRRWWRVGCQGRRPKVSAAVLEEGGGAAGRCCSLGAHWGGRMAGVELLRTAAVEMKAPTLYDSPPGIVTPACTARFGWCSVFFLNIEKVAHVIQMRLTACEVWARPTRSTFV